MGKWVSLLVLIGGIFIGYRTYIYKSPAFETYEKFAAALWNGKCSEMQALVEGQAKAYVDDLCKPRTMTMAGVTINLDSKAGMISDMAATPAGASMRRSLEKVSETKSDDGSEVSLVIIEKVGMPSRRNKELRGPERHRVKVKDFGGNWKVVEFSKEDVK